MAKRNRAGRDAADARGRDRAAPKPQAERPGPPPEQVPVIVGVGASAGGLDAFMQLVEHVRRGSGLAIVLVQHLSPQHESMLPQLLTGRTELTVVQAAEGMRVEPDHVYVIPPSVYMGLRDGTLALVPRPVDRAQYMPVDFFLRSLAETVRSRSVAVILSGTASDGAQGIRDVKAAGGLVFAQEPESAKFDGMPRAAIATGVVDRVLEPSAIAADLVAIGAHPYLRDGALDQTGEEERPSEEPAPQGPPKAGAKGPQGRSEQLERVFALLRGATGVDFGRYKRPTIERRLHRRMALHKLTRLSRYLAYLEENPGEVQALYQDILIHVTRFFREPGSFQALADVVFPQILRHRGQDQPLRIWVCGCSTGEEAYSVAMVLLELLGDESFRVPVQIFATDISERAIGYARAGFYPASIAADVSPERLRRFFTKVDGGYRIAKAVRDLCIFARQDVTSDPPFSKLDLVLCRNVLIYLTVPLQKKLMSVFHHALKRTGFLMLGNSETIGLHGALFVTVDKKSRIYGKRLGEAVPEIAFPPPHAQYFPVAGGPRRGLETAGESGRSLQGEMNRVILDRYAPPGVLVDADLQIVQFRGQTGPYLEPAPGDPSLSLLKMAREGLLHGLRKALGEAQRSDKPVRSPVLRVRSNGASVIENVTPYEREVRDHQGNWLSLRIRPYKDTDNRIDGAVLSLFDIQSLKQQDEMRRAVHAFARTLLELAERPVAIVDAAGRITCANPALAAVAGTTPEALVGRQLDDVCRRSPHLPAIRAALAQVGRDGEPGRAVRQEAVTVRSLPPVDASAALLAVEVPAAPATEAEERG